MNEKKSDFRPAEKKLDINDKNESLTKADCSCTSNNPDGAPAKIKADCSCSTNNPEGK